MPVKNKRFVNTVVVIYNCYLYYLLSKSFFNDANEVLRNCEYWAEPGMILFKHSIKFNFALFCLFK